MVDGKSFRLADEVRDIQRRAAEHDERIVSGRMTAIFGCSTQKLAQLGFDIFGRPRPSIPTRQHVPTPAQQISNMFGSYWSGL